ncbi:hypothetical protein PR048_020061 [Dryococelus australis]|uniref:Uncharacterized protein n=1 Tax=Dryococelus australis TaxID=614101 RepID=A0ABQ9H585_9NEOP|nr:hypothetical protein PR048_020061 [Dryococelus australis]
MPGYRKKKTFLGVFDASKWAFGAFLFLPHTDVSTTVCANLLCSKSRMMHLQKLSLPRLELCASLLVSQLLGKKTLKLLSVSYSSYILWSDSAVHLEEICYHSSASNSRNHSKHGLEICKCCRKSCWPCLKESGTTALREYFTRKSVISRLEGMSAQRAEHDSYIHILMKLDCFGHSWVNSPKTSSIYTILEHIHILLWTCTSLSYVDIIVCLSTKAIHTKLVAYGRCVHIYNDNVTYFVGEHRKLTDLH